MIRRGFIERVHRCFDELNYHVDGDYDHDGFFECAVATISRCKGLKDVISAIDMTRYCLDRERKIERLFERMPDKFDEYPYAGKPIVATLPEEEASSIVYTNAFRGGRETLSIISHDDDQDKRYVEIKPKDGAYRCNEGGYYLLSGGGSSKMAKVFNDRRECVCEIGLDENYELFLDANTTPYIFLSRDDDIRVFKVEYADTVSNGKYAPEESVASIKWDIVNVDGRAAVAMLNFLQEDVDRELIECVAMSTVVLIDGAIKKDKKGALLRAIIGTRRRF